MRSSQRHKARSKQRGGGGTGGEIDTEARALARHNWDSMPCNGQVKPARSQPKGDQRSQGTSGPIRCKQLTYAEQAEVQELAQADWSRPMLAEVEDAILERAVQECQRLFEKARQMALSWEEEWTLVYFKTVVAAEMHAAGEEAPARCLMVRSRALQDVEVQVDDVRCSRDFEVQVDDVQCRRDLEVQVDLQAAQDFEVDGPSMRTLRRRERKKNVEKKWAEVRQGAREV